MNVKLPRSFRRRITGAFGEKGSDWLSRLPDLLRDYRERWQLTLPQPAFPLSYNYVVPVAMSDGSAAVLKLGVPHDEIDTEIEALRLFDGHGAVRLLRYDASGGALLLERAIPGTMLLDEEDDGRATEIAAGLMRRLPKPAPTDHGLFTVKRWAQGFQRLHARFDGGTGPLPPTLVEKAEAIYRELLAESRPQVVLHGDLHHENILLSRDRGWLAIDPKGVAGEAEYETGALLRNPPGLARRTGLDRLLAGRLDRLAEILGYERQRLALWAAAQAILSAWWSVEDDGGRGWQGAVFLAKRFLALAY